MHKTRHRPTFKGAVETKEKRNDKDDAQPPRLRQTKQASPPDIKIYLYLFFMFSQKPLTLLTSCAEQE